MNFAPLTASSGMSLATALSYTQGAPAGAELGYVRRATVFVCHVWGSSFADTLAALEAFAAAQERPEAVAFWIDLFCLPQHAAGSSRPHLDPAWVGGPLVEAVRSIGHTCAVLQPWLGELATGRSWCLWEMLTTIRTAGKLTVQL